MGGGAGSASGLPASLSLLAGTILSLLQGPAHCSLMQLVHPAANQSLHTCRSHPTLFQPLATIRQNHHGGFLPLDAFLMTALQRVRCALCRFSTEDISSFVRRDDCADFGGNWASLVAERASLWRELNMGENLCASAPISGDAYMGELLLHSESVDRWLPD